MKKALVVLVFVLFTAIAFAAEVTEQQASSSLDDALAGIAEMKAAGFGTTQVADIFILLNYSYINKNYANVIKRSAEISGIKEAAFEINDSLKVFGDKMAAYAEIGFNVSAAEAIFGDAKTAFMNEKYGDAEDLLAGAYKSLDEIKTKNIMSQTILEAGKRNIAYFIKENIAYIILGVFSAFIIGLVLYSRFEIMAARRKLDDLELERGVIFELMKKAQTQCYQDKTLSYDEYKAKIRRLKERLVQINEELPAIKLKAVKELPSVKLDEIIGAIPFRRKKR